MKFFWALCLIGFFGFAALMRAAMPGWLSTAARNNANDPESPFRAAAPTATVTIVVPAATATAVAATPPITATAQMLWKNGVQSPWWGQTYTLTTYTIAVTTTNAAVTDNLTGDTTSLALVTSANDIGNPASFNFYINLPVNASNYYASGHIQFDIEMGPAYTNGISPFVSYGSDAIAGCSSVPAQFPALSTSTFTHVSIPFNGLEGVYYPSCNYTAAMNNFAIAFGSAGSYPIPLGTGIVGYINAVEITPN